jgi:hypothetical protein
VEVEVYKFLNSVTDGDESYVPQSGHFHDRDYLEPTEQKAGPTFALDMKTTNIITCSCQDLNLTHAVTCFID